jgi:hypothetical protein
VAGESSDRRELVVVVMNPGAQNKEAELRLPMAGKVNLHDAYERSKAHDLQTVNGQMENAMYNFPAESVRTLVIRGRDVHEIP